MSDKISTEVRELILQYFKAFSHLYAIISMKRAFRIIKQQNPDIELSEETFIEFFLEYMDSEEYEKQHYILVYDEEMYDLEPEKNDPMKIFLITEYLYAIDNEDYYILKEQQEGRKFYIPEKDELLKYADEHYSEINSSCQAMVVFLMKEFNITEAEAWESIEDDVGIMRIQLPHEDDIEWSLAAIERITHKKNFESSKAYPKFLELFEDIQANVRRHAYRGHSAKEIGLRPMS